jgi:hypothetical protein
MCKQNAYHSIPNEIELQFRKWMVRNALAHLISRASWCKTSQRIPMEEGRVWCSEDAIGAYFDTLERLLFRLACNVIYNVD